MHELQLHHVLQFIFNLQKKNKKSEIAWNMYISTYKNNVQYNGWRFLILVTQEPNACRSIHRRCRHENPSCLVPCLWSMISLTPFYPKCSRRPPLRIALPRLCWLPVHRSSHTILNHIWQTHISTTEYVSGLVLISTLVQYKYVWCG